MWRVEFQIACLLRNCTMVSTLEVWRWNEDSPSFILKSYVVTMVPASAAPAQAAALHPHRHGFHQHQHCLHLGFPMPMHRN